jgi:hypothetical protein
MAMIYIADDVRSIAARLKEIEAERKPVRQGKEDRHRGPTGAILAPRHVARAKWFLREANLCILEIRSDIAAALAASRACEQRFDVGQPHAPIARISAKMIFAGGSSWDRAGAITSFRLKLCKLLVAARALHASDQACVNTPALPFARYRDYARHPRKGA